MKVGKFHRFSSHGIGAVNESSGGGQKTSSLMVKIGLKEEILEIGLPAGSGKAGRMFHSSYASYRKTDFARSSFSRKNAVNLRY